MGVENLAKKRVQRIMYKATPVQAAAVPRGTGALFFCEVNPSTTGYSTFLCLRARFEAVSLLLFLKHAKVKKFRRAFSWILHTRETEIIYSQIAITF